MKQSKQTAKQFIKLDLNLLRGNGLNLNENVFISYLIGWQTQDKICYETQSQIAEYLDIPIATFKRMIKKLINKEVIFVSQDRKYLIPFNNRKAIIYVDSNNPLPTKVNTPAESEIKIKKVIVPEVIKEIVAEKPVDDSPNEESIEVTEEIKQQVGPTTEDKAEMRKFVANNRYNILGIHKDELKSLIRRGKITLDEIKEKYYVDHNKTNVETNVEVTVNIDPMTCDEDDFLKLLDK